MHRRTFLRNATAGAGALLVSRALPALATGLGPVDRYGTARTSRLFPGTTLLHADLHNHSLFSDGDGDAAQAFASMRAAGLDVAALTDHASGDKAASHACSEGDCPAIGLDEAEWRKVSEYADKLDERGAFVAIRGFEWSASVPQTGHVNVWFTETWTDPVATAHAATAQGAGQYLNEYGPAELHPVAGQLDSALRSSPANDPALAGFYEWLGADPARPVLGGGRDGIAGFNHPGREYGRFGYFAYNAAVADRVVSVEVFNRRDDYLFEGVDRGQPSPIVECLDRGWRTGLLGVTDEHGTDWGVPEGKGRTGLWVTEWSRAGVQEAMRARRFFATNLRGLRLDASATPAGADPVRLGGTLPAARGPVTFTLDIDRGPGWVGPPLRVQVLRTGRPLPTVVAESDITVAGPTAPLPTVTVDLDPADGRWVFLRVTDPSQPADGRATTDPYRGAGKAIAYSSPWWFANP